MKKNKVIVAIDNNNLKDSIKLVNLIKNEVYAFKIGYEFFLNFGISGYNKIKNISPNIFLDLKLHDIPNTVKNGVAAINKLNPILTTIHVSGGDEMMKCSILSKRKTKILGVSILTSLNRSQIIKYYNEANINNLVKKFAKQAKKNKLDGLVCSPKEIPIVRQEVGKNFLIVTPGIRPDNMRNNTDDQKRTMSPKKAIELGASLLVIGRPITSAKNPLKELLNINSTLI